MKQIKCGIITIHNIPNYGATYQALGLMSFLNRQNGVHAELIDYHMNQNSSYSPHQSCSKISTIVSRLCRIITKFPKIIYAIKARKKEHSFRLFWKRYYQLSENRLNGDSSFSNAVLPYDVLIAGSDQLFNLSLTNGSIAYFLPVKEGYRLSYSTSFGMNGLEAKNEATVVELLKNFHSLSVREQTVSDYLHLKYGIKSEVTIDPVFLLTSSEWKEYSERITLPKRYIFCYLMSEDPNARAVLSWIESQEGTLPVVIISTLKRKLSIKGKDYSGVGPSEFLTIISNAEYIVTNSFHGCALGIIHEKKVFSLEEERYVGDQRYKTLLNACDSSNKIVPYNTNWAEFDFKSHIIDGKSCYQLLRPWINESIQFLLNKIRLCQE